MGILFIIFLSSLVSNYYLIQYLISFLTKLKIIDIPDNARKAHKYSVPRGAGVSLVITLSILSVLGEWLFLKSYQFSIKFVPLLLMISTISLLDDIKSSPITLRLIVHFLTATLSIFLFLSPNVLFHEWIPDNIDFIIAVFAFTSFINIFNFLDGMDGLTGIETVHLSLTILLLCYFKYDVIINVNLIIIIAIIVLAFAIAFLLFNWPPAKIFIGDIGSISLGFALGLCLLLLAASEMKLFLACIIASLYYLFDGGITIIIRLINKEKIWQPHFKHFFQRAVMRGKSNIIILRKIIICNACLMGISILSLYSPLPAVFLAVTTVLLTISSLVR